ncbi:MAG: transglycosylase domain-containing protein [Lachnospiraceae bacterium]|nr:transglycosylase domain-containing protein [Lachnospiraceae bacterium]
MNYGKRGIENRLKTLNSRPEKLKKMFLVSSLKLSLIGIIAVCILVMSLGLGAFKGILSDVPEVSLDDLMPNGYATMVYDTEGNLIQKLVSENANRTYVQMELIPENLAHAFVAIEDARYYEHNGIDIQGIIRAGLVGVTNGFNFTEGASTITQQLLKNNVFTDWMSEDTFIDRVKRKLQEQYLALEISKEYDKDTLLCLYMNTINLGANTLGVQAASMRYFDKHVKDLTLSECAVIAAITQNPSRYNPITNPENNKEKRGVVLKYMWEQGYISRAEYEDALADDVYARIQNVTESSSSSGTYSYFIDELTEQVTQDLLDAGYTSAQAYNILYSSGAKLYSTQDSKIQAICDEIFANEENYPSNSKWYLNYQLTILKADGTYEHHSTQMFRSYFKEKNSKFNLIYATHEDAQADIDEYIASVLEEGDEVFDETITLTLQPQVSFVIQDQQTGHVLAMIGGRGEKTASRTLNRATNTMRQPGSTFKVLSTYAPALDISGMTLATIQTDAPFNYEDGTPVSNWWDGGTYKGNCSVRYAIEQSLNIIAVKTMTINSPELGYTYVEDFGITTMVDSKTTSDGRVLTDKTQSLSLGGVTDGVTNLELNAAYAAIANGGTYIEPILYTQLVAADGTIILDNTIPKTKQVIKPTTAFLLTSAMTDVVTKGTGTAANFEGMTIAGKTGTTSKNNDFWFAGYTPYYTATVWAGYDNNVSMNTKEEKNFHKALWKKVMQAVHEGLPGRTFPMPSGITTATICSQSGKLPIAGLCDDCLILEYFEEGTAPTTFCDLHFEGWVCPMDMLPATNECPFSVPGRTVIPAPLDPMLISGSTMLLEDGTTIYPNTTGKCSHTAGYLMDPVLSANIQPMFNGLSDDIKNAILLHHPALWIGGVYQGYSGVIPPISPITTEPAIPAF